MRKSSLFKDIKLYARLYALRALRICQTDFLDDLWHEEQTIREISYLALEGGLEATVNTLAAGRITPAAVFKAWKNHTQGAPPGGRLLEHLRSPRRRLCKWFRSIFSRR